jgi:hypothetical protein
MVTVNGRPFKALSDSGFRKILDPILKGFGGTFNISPENIRDEVEGKATDKKRCEKSFCFCKNGLCDSIRPSSFRHKSPV